MFCTTSIILYSLKNDIDRPKFFLKITGSIEMRRRSLSVTSAGRSREVLEQHTKT